MHLVKIMDLHVLSICDAKHRLLVRFFSPRKSNISLFISSKCSSWVDWLGLRGPSSFRGGGLAIDVIQYLSVEKSSFHFSIGFVDKDFI